MIHADHRCNIAAKFDEGDEMENNKPVYEKRVGHCRLAIWENVTKGKDGRPDKVWHNVTIVRQYKNGNDEWQEAPTFNGLGDLALLAACVELARTWIIRKEEQQQ